MKNNDNRIKKLMEMVEKQTAELGTKPRFTPKTNAKFNFNDQEYFNLNVESKISTYTRAFAFLLMKDDYNRTACELLDVEYEPFIWYGYSLEDWQEDFKQRVKIIKWNQRKQKLNNTKNQLDSLLSAEGKTAGLLDEIEEMLS